MLTAEQIRSILVDTTKQGVGISLFPAKGPTRLHDWFSDTPEGLWVMLDNRTWSDGNISYDPDDYVFISDTKVDYQGFILFGPDGWHQHPYVALPGLTTLASHVPTSFSSPYPEAIQAVYKVVEEALKNGDTQVDVAVKAIMCLQANGFRVIEPADRSTGREWSWADETPEDVYPGSGYYVLCQNEDHDQLGPFATYEEAKTRAIEYHGYSKEDYLAEDTIMSVAEYEQWLKDSSEEAEPDNTVNRSDESPVDEGYTNLYWPPKPDPASWYTDVPNEGIGLSVILHKDGTSSIDSISDDKVDYHGFHGFIFYMPGDPDMYHPYVPIGGRPARNPDPEYFKSGDAPEYQEGGVYYTALMTLTEAIPNLKDDPDIAGKLDDLMQGMGWRPVVCDDDKTGGRYFKWRDEPAGYVYPAEPEA